jgi:hypothetical protein
MIIEKYKCNHCGKETEDYYIEIGWIHIEGHEENTEISITTVIVIAKGRDEIGCSKTIKVDNNFDFCNFKCLKEFFHNIVVKD